MKRVKTILLDLAFMAAGAVVYAVSVNAFTSPNNIAPGGVTGIATMLNYLFSTPIGLVAFLINIPIKVLTDISVDLIEFAVHDFTFPQALHPAVEVVHGVACRNDNGYCRCQGHQRNGDAQ